jgi:serine/threonine protein kinase
MIPRLGKVGNMSRKEPKVFDSGFEAYTVVQQLGSGGAGTVYEVKASDGQRLALKALDRSGVSRKQLARFRNEMRFCSQPRSRHIIQVIDQGKGDGEVLFYVMPYFSGTLRKRMRAGIKGGDVLPLYNQVLDGVEAAHLLGAVHRDIKPENILYDDANQLLVLADFGIARFQEDALATTIHTSPSERLANFAYAAPEQRVPGTQVDARADIYALGLLLNEMFTGQIPLGSGIRSIKDAAPGFAYLDGLVDLMIQQRPEERPHSVRKVKEQLIGRGNEFVALQTLDRLKREVVPESSLGDPLIEDPIRIVDKESYRDGVLTVRLNMEINQKWERCFRERATQWSSNCSAANISFNGDKAHISATEHNLQRCVDYLKQYLGPANETYAAHVTEEHRREIQRARNALAFQIRQAEATMDVMKKIRV